MSALVHGLRILKLFSDHTPALGLSDISRLLAISKSNTHRILSIMVQERILEKTPGGMYRLGLALFELGSLTVSHHDLEQAARPVMTALVRQVLETVHLCILDGTEVVYIRKTESPYNLRITTRVGGRGPAYCTSTGKAILAFQPVDVVQAVIDAGLKRMTPETITDPDLFIRHLQQVRELGYAVCDEEVEHGVRAVAAPIRNRLGEVIASISLVGPITRLPRSRTESTARMVIEAARNISLELGYDVRQRRTAGRDLSRSGA